MNKFLCGASMVALSVLIVSCSALAANEAAGLNLPLAPEIGLEEMLFRQIPMVAVGTLTEENLKHSPSSTTIITSEMIEMAPARNIYDLLEMFVPGVTYLTHYDSSHIGIRGLQGDRDYRALLLLNGRLINQKATNGMTTELENWDLNDIERIEVVRGPGSVTYGPGAIAGVINIVTKNADTGKGKRAGLTYVGNYNSAGGYASLGETFERMKVYSYFSYRRTNGADVNIYYMDPRVAGSGGRVGGGGLYGQYDPASYYSDTEEMPQLKFNTQIDFLEELSLLVRFTNSGTSRIRSWTEWPDTNRLHVGKYTADGEYVNGSETRNRQLLVSLTDSHIFANDSTLKSTLSFDSMDGYRRQFDDTWNNILLGNGSQDPRHPNNMAWNYSESHLLFQSIYNFDLFDKHKIAIGGEYSYENYGPGWGQDPEDAVIFDGSVIYCSPNPRALEFPSFYSNANYTKSSGFSLFNYALFQETNLKLTDNLSVLLGTRLDKNKFSRFLVSPRVSTIWDAEKFGIFKFTWQESLREPTAVNLYLQGREGRKAEPEDLKSFEFDYSNNFGKFDFNFATFANQLKAISWNSANQASEISGRLRTWGAEFDLAYKTEKNTAGFSYSYTKQIDWELANHAGGNSAISVADYDQTYQLPAGMTALSNTGNDLLNWPNQMAKFYTINQLTKKLKLFFECIALWDYAGEKDWMTMWENASKGTASEQTVTNNIQSLRNSKLYHIDFRANISLKYQFNENVSMNIFAMNFLPIFSNHRYQYMQQSVVAIKEPTVFGWRMDVKY